MGAVVTSFAVAVLSVYLVVRIANDLVRFAEPLARQRLLDVDTLSLVVGAILVVTLTEPLGQFPKLRLLAAAATLGGAVGAVCLRILRTDRASPGPTYF